MPDTSSTSIGMRNERRLPWKAWGERKSGHFLQDYWLAQKAVPIFRQAGFSRVETRAKTTLYRNLHGLTTVLLDAEGSLLEGYQYLFDARLLERATVERAKMEIQEWQEDPNRFLYEMELLIVARP